MRWLAGLAVVIGAMTVVGCAPRVEIPPGPTKAELEQVQQKSSEAWWQLMQPGEDQPPVPRIQYVTTAEQGPAVQKCVDDAVALYSTSQSLAAWACYQRFPLDLTSMEQQGVMSPAQLEYLYSYFIDRLVPCLRLQGYLVANEQDHDTFMAASVGYPSWNPYYSLAAVSRHPADWDLIAARCPPPFAADLLVPHDPGP